MTGRSSGGPARSVTIVGSRMALTGLTTRLERRGVTVHRVVVLVPIPPARAVAAFPPRPTTAIDTLVLTSRAGVRSLTRVPGLLAALRRNPGLWVLAVGPGTAAALEQAGLPPDWSPSSGGSSAIAARLLRSPPRRVLYPRSSRAGPRLARLLRRQGHVVFDPITYRVAPAARLGAPDVRRVLEADRLVVTSPSALSHLRSGLGPASFRRLRARRGIVVLGERSARAARGHGFRGVRRAPTTAEQGFTRFLVRELRRDD